MDKKRKAIEYFRKGFNCSQTVVLACAGTEETAVKSAAGFGGGMGRMQKTCGAVTGAYICLGIKYGKTEIPAEEDKIMLYNKITAFYTAFIERNGSDQCSVLLGENINTPEGKARISEKNLHEKVCEKCICDTLEILDTL